MKSVYVLGNDRTELSLLFQLSQAQMAAVGLDPVDHQLFPVKAVVLLGKAFKKRVAQNRLGRVFPFLVVQAVDAAEIGNPALRADARSAKENDVVAVRDPLFELRDILFHDVPSRMIYIAASAAAMISFAQVSQLFSVISFSRRTIKR